MDTGAFGDDWSQVEEQVSRTLRDLRGQTKHSGGSSVWAHSKGQLPNMTSDSARYNIEFVVLPDYVSPNPFYSN